MRTANRHIGHSIIEPTLSCKRKLALTRQTKHRILHKNKIMTKKKTRGGVIYLNGSEEQLKITVAFNLLHKQMVRPLLQLGAGIAISMLMYALCRAIGLAWAML